MGTETKKAKGRVVFDTDRCKGCGLCVAFCPTKTLAIDESAINAKGYSPAVAAYPEKCIGCGTCAICCPDSIITVYRED